jgi:shikimate kinase/3-dehydroquinate synthase
MAAPLFLVGFMAAGKTSVGAALAQASGRRFVDLDDTIDVADAGSVAALVARDEPEFRRREAAALARVIAQADDGPIVATGGGAAAYSDNMDRMRAAGCVVALNVDVDVAIKRAAGGPSRPLLADAGRLAAQRAPIYRRAHAVVETSGRTLGEVARDVAHVESAHRRFGGDPIVALGDRTYAIVIADGAPTTPAGAVVITDENVARHHALPGADTIVIAPGEASKCFATYERLSEQLVTRGLDRGSTIYALGGGVVGDLAGFVAATLYRGITIVQLPTTLVAMTDAAIGGKTAIDLPAGKNLVGAFHQPALVYGNLATLATLPERERRAGFGELWKYALLDGRDLWRAVAACTAWAAAGGAPPQELRDVIRRCAAYKAAIVGRDERERTGHRALLNLGHTVGHAIEAASGLHHGEAVALGLIAAAHVSASLGVGSRELEAEVTQAVHRTGLPANLAPYLRDDVLDRLGVDKKRSGGKLRFVVIREVGSCEPVEIAVTELRRILRSRPTA